MQTSKAAVARARLPNRRPTDFASAGSQPASPIGAALDLLIAHESRPDGVPSSE